MSQLFSREAAGGIDNLLEQFDQHLQATISHWEEPGMVDGLPPGLPQAHVMNMLTRLREAGYHLGSVRVELMKLENSSWWEDPASEEEEDEENG